MMYKALRGHWTQALVPAQSELKSKETGATTESNRLVTHEKVF